MLNDRSRGDWLQIHNRAARDYINSEWSREFLLGMARQRKKLLANARGAVLDVGCGYGINFPYLTHARSITGIDASTVMLKKARERMLKSTMKVDLREGDAEALEFPDHSFDTVISTLCTCSFYNPVQALQEIRRVCKPDGKILLLEHGRSTWEWAGRYQDRHLQQQIEQGGCRWNQEPQELVTEAGLEILLAERSLLGVLHSMVISPAKLDL
jgi:ubiquinone/menaquinone biosynthesis C-methylase UbiE